MKKIISLLLSIISISVYGQDFSLVVIPDTQYETADTYGNPQMLYSQTQWIADNKTDSNIVYVSHVGDITQSNLTVEWQRADTAMSIIENADIPFSLCTGNHDGLDNTDFDDYFGADRFTDKSWYGGHYSTSNVNNYSFFEEGGMEFMVIHLQYAVSSFNAILHWASDLLKTYSEKRAIVVSHDILEPDGDFSAEGQEIYDSLKANPNLFLMWGGHYHTAPLYGSRRTDVYNGNTIHTVMSCYQHTNGGDGWIRLAKFSPADDSIYVSTYSPYLDQYWPDMDENYFSLYYNMPYAEDIRPHVFYVQDPAYNANASDSNVGNDIDYPWATWQHAFDMAGIGDTVYFRGGVWYSTERVLVGSYGHPAKVGKPDSLICFMNYPGETPILDCRNHTTTGHDNGLNISYSYYIKLRGLTVRYCRQRVDSQYITGIEIGYAFGGPVWLERLTSHGNWGNGIEFAGYDTLYVTSCDSYDNADSLSITTGIGNRADGFGGGSGGTETDTFKIAYWEGCRSWHNSDDGFDFGTSKQIQVTNCWSFLNGYLPEGGGIGFKTGPSHVGISSKRRIYKTLAAFNNYPAYADQNMDDAYYGPVVEYSNNTSYKNQIGFISDNNTFNCNTGRAKVKYNNNLVYKSRMSYFDQMYLTLCHSAAPYYPHYTNNNNNTWIYDTNVPYWKYNPLVKVTDDDFFLIDSTAAIAELTAPRKKDGSLPELTFLKLKENSDLIDAGIDIGLAFSGEFPDIGFSEFTSGSPTESIPEYLSSEINDKTPSLLEITYNLTLANIVPTVSSFSVTVNSSPRNITSVAVSGTKVLLTLTNPVVYDDIITIAYTKPATNPLQTPTGKQASSFHSQMVTNNCRLPANQPPVSNISSPGKNSTYIAPATIELDIDAYDPDGTISKVELFNGDVKLIEIKNAPYSFTWKDVPAGSYSIIAVVTDNMNVLTRSTPVYIVVKPDLTKINTIYDNNSEIINLYPNPNNGVFTIELKNRTQSKKSEINIVSSSGKSVYRDTLLEEQLSKEFDLSKISTGLYVMILSNKNILVTKKFLKK